MGRLANTCMLPVCNAQLQSHYCQTLRSTCNSVEGGIDGEDNIILGENVQGSVDERLLNIQSPIITDNANRLTDKEGEERKRKWQDGDDGCFGRPRRQQQTDDNRSDPTHDQQKL